MKKRWIAVGIFAVLAAGAVGLAAMQGPEQQADMKEIYAKTDALDAGRTPVEAPTSPTPSDTIRYDPENARKSQIADIVAMNARTCIEATIQSQLAQGNRSRSDILDKSQQCGLQYVTQGIFSQKEADAYVRVEADGLIGPIAAEGR